MHPKSQTIQGQRTFTCKEIFNLNKWVGLNPITYMLKGFCLYTVIFPIFGPKCTILVKVQL